MVPQLRNWTFKEGEDFQDLEDLYEQVFNQFNRYMGHVIANVGGVYENYKTYDQSGAVYSHVDNNRQKECVQFLNDQLFKTPNWMVDPEISNKIEFTGILERIRKTQASGLNKLLDFARLARIIENSAINKNSAYSLIELFTDLQNGIWSEVKTGNEIDVYRRSLQKAYVERLDYLINKEQSEIKGLEKYSLKRTSLTISQSDIVSVSRAKLEELKRLINKKLPSYRDEISKYHLKDVVFRIEQILNPK